MIETSGEVSEDFPSLEYGESCTQKIREHGSFSLDVITLSLTGGLTQLYPDDPSGKHLLRGHLPEVCRGDPLTVSAPPELTGRVNRSDCGGQHEEARMMY
jgi:hypothetical protein